MLTDWIGESCVHLIMCRVAAVCTQVTCSTTLRCLLFAGTNVFYISEDLHKSIKFNTSTKLYIEEGIINIINTLYTIVPKGISLLNYNNYAFRHSVYQLGFTVTCTFPR